VTSPNDTIPDDRPPAPDPDPRPPDDRDLIDCDGCDNSEPMVDVPAGLIGTAIELLDLCDELFNRPGSKALDTTVAAVIGRYQRADIATVRWFHDGLSITAWRLHELLEDQGIVIEPELHGRHGLLYHP
jgi:hypothetical protein